MEVREQLLQRFPGDPLAPRCLYDNAEGYEAIADFERAADAYERYFREWRKARAAPAPKPAPPPQKKDAKAAAAVPAPPASPTAPPAYEEKKATDAIINAAVFRAGLRDWARAEADSQAYLEVWPDGEDAARMSLSLADLAARQGQAQKELTRLEEYQRRYAKTPDEWLAAQQRIARVMEKAGNAAGARAAQDQGFEYWKRNRDKVKDQGLPIAAEGMFRALEPSWAEYQKLNLNVPQRDVDYQLKRMAGKLKKLEEEYTAVVKLGVAGPAVCALERIGMLYAHFGKVLLEAPVPKEIKNDKDLVEVYKAHAGGAGRAAGDQGPGRLRPRGHQGARAGRPQRLRHPGDAGGDEEEARAGAHPGGPAGPAGRSTTLGSPRGYGLLSALEAPATARRPAAPGRGSAAPAPPLKQPAPQKGAAKPGARAKEPPPPAAPSDDPLPRPKKGEDEDLLQ